MKTLIVAMNSKYIHSSLAPWYLKAYCGDECGEIKVFEFTINDNLDSVLSSVYTEKPDLIAFSCYIWNISYVLRLVESLKAVLPHTVMVLGGPEVSYDPEDVIKNVPAVDYVICGEGEETFKLLLKSLCEGIKVVDGIEGLVGRNGCGEQAGSSYRLVRDLDTIPSPYTEEMLSRLGDRIVYYESSRGCPFSCSYCLSSTYSGVRYFSLPRVKRDLKKLIDANVKQVKFVDRTFNAHRERAKEIIKFIIENIGEGKTNFHFEAAADLFDEEMLDMLSQAPAGLIQFEIGIQTTNPAALAEIGRKTDIGKAFLNIRGLMNMRNIHIHLDLIAGLPYEDFKSFRESFNRVYALQPHHLQLGFLKMLKGSRIRADAEKHDYKFKGYPPYEVLSNRYISFDDITVLKGVEDLVERYYNSGKFKRSLEFAINRLFESPFDFYTAFRRHYRDRGYYSRSVSGRETYTIFLEFVEITAGGTGDAEADKVMSLFRDLLKFDFLASDNSGNLPEGLAGTTDPRFREKCFDFLKDEKNIAAYLPEYMGMPAKQIFKQVRFERFDHDVTERVSGNLFVKKPTVVLFDYGSRDRVTGEYRYVSVRFKE